MEAIEEACKQPGISRLDDGLNLHFSPIPNWYGCILGFECPICGQSIDWKWIGKLGAFTGDDTPSRVKPVVTGAALKSYGHRWIALVCDTCKIDLRAENFG